MTIHRRSKTDRIPNPLHTDPRRRGFNDLPLFGSALPDLLCIQIHKIDRHCRHVSAVHYQFQVYGASAALERHFLFLHSQEYLKEFSMTYQNYLIDAVNLILDWDIPDEALVDAVIAQAGLMAGISPDDITVLYPD
ncbi:hypothetical protein [Nitrosomonas halophila]|nr:hypothetical protein [Nitrosomonas halophila]HRQ06287.1 hypothetical protein [Nitrosomonas halophila]